MITVAPLPDAALDTFADIALNAYPGMKVFSAEDKRRWKEQLQKRLSEVPSEYMYGAWQDDSLVGGMRLFDFVMNMRGTPIELGGVGLVAVDLLHKKEQVAKHLIATFLEHYRERGVAMTSLYAFRHDFYKRMGFGYGTKNNQYRLKPGNLPRGRTKQGLRYLGPQDAPAVADCYRRIYHRTHGMFERFDLTILRTLENTELRWIGYQPDDQLHGYIVFTFKPSMADNILANDIHIQELVYEDREALANLITFLQTQTDQIQVIWLNTQDEYFHHLPLDARNGSDNIFSLYHETNIQGLGIMYRIVDVKALFRQLHDHRWGNVSCRLKLTVADSFLPANAGSIVLHVEQGIIETHDNGAHDVELRLDIAELSSLVMGVIPLRRLYLYGLAELSDPQALDTIDSLFYAPEKPICLTRF